MTRREKIVKKRLEEELYPHFHENIDSLRLSDNLSKDGKSTEGKYIRRRLTPLVATLAVLILTFFVWIQWNREGHIEHLEEPSAISGNQIMNDIPPDSTGMTSVPSSTEGAKGSTSNSFGYDKKSTTLKEAENFLNMTLPTFPSLDIIDYELIIQEDLPIAFRYCLRNEGYIEIRKQPLKMKDAKEIMIDDHVVFMQESVDYIRLLAEDETLFFDIKLYDDKVVADKILIDLFSFYER